MILKLGTRVSRAGWECDPTVCMQAGTVPSERKEDRRVVGDSGLKTFESDNRLAQIWSTLGSDIGIKIGYRSGPGLTECAFCNFPIHRIIASVGPALSAFSKNPAS
ncbi:MULTISPECIES: hypothetical protein [unclassified Mesorhizobium]|uniref:hypothetical protein n=1 Tax=unclassified Mesorhizobium TaxID=325217 RepID=UPI000FE8DC61|nr:MULTISPECIES: hypothetical protein [unclassified Mesorhizobium]RWB94977.1 MAG: hypothetical protein EOQ57_30525 [Mesorhizobium sp.]TGV18319.1 hypothetical protein EN786_34100 [Mesorhizobium sp. M4B.F.Ca.ET.143.01.1.1]